MPIISNREIRPAAALGTSLEVIWRPSHRDDDNHHHDGNCKIMMTMMIMLMRSKAAKGSPEIRKMVKKGDIVPFRRPPPQKKTRKKGTFVV